MTMMQNRPFAILFVLLVFIATSSTAQPPNTPPPGAIVLNWRNRGNILPQQGGDIETPLQLTRGGSIWYQPAQVFPGTQLWQLTEEQWTYCCGYAMAGAVPNRCPSDAAAPVAITNNQFNAGIGPAPANRPLVPVLQQAAAALIQQFPAAVIYPFTGTYYMAGSPQECQRNAKFIVKVGNEFDDYY